MTANATTNYEYIGDGNTLGTIVGQSGGKIGFYGTTPIVKATVTAVATGATAATIVTSLQALQTALNTLGLIANA